MVWFNVDDGFSTSPKVLVIPRADRMPAIGLWTIAGSWCAKHMTDGNFGAFMLDEWGASQGSVDMLVAAALWDVTPEGFVFHDWPSWQRTREQIEADREKERLRKSNYRNKKAGEREEPPGDVSRGRPGGSPVSVPRVSQHPSQANPFPTKPTLLSTKDVVEESTSVSELRPEVEGLCVLLRDLVVANGSKSPTIGQGWLTAARLLLVNDGRDPLAAERLMRWCQADPFWRGNILSMPKFRAKYDELRLHAERERTDRQAKTPKDQQILDVIETGRRLQAEHDRKALSA